MRIAVCFRGQLRTYKYTLENLKRYFNTLVDEDTTIDYFVHTWNDNLYFPTDNHKLSDRENGSYRPADLDRDYLEDNIPNLRALVIENHDDYKRRSTTVEHWGALFYSIYEVNLLKRKYEIQNNFKYDLVINSRFDLVFPLKDTFPKFNYKENCAYTFMHLAEMRNEGGFLNFDDMIFYGTSATVDNIAKIYPNIIIPQLDQKKFEKYWEKNESWDDVPLVYKLGPGSLLSQYMDDRGIEYSDLHPRYFSVARKEVEDQKLDGINDYGAIRQIHLDFYNKLKFKVIKDSFATKPHALNDSEETEFQEFYHTPFKQNMVIDPSALKFTTYGSSEIENIIECKSETFDTIPDDVLSSNRFLYIYPLFIANFLPWHSSLEIIPKKILDGCRNNKIWILFENLLEGDTVPDHEWLSLHLTLDKLQIPARNIIFTNNNILLKEKYLEWFLSQNIFNEQIRVEFIPYDILNIKKLIKNDKLYESISFDNLYEFKKQNLNKCKHFLKVNRTPRNERIAANIFLMEKGILENTKISCTEYAWDETVDTYNYKWVTHESKRKFKELLPLGTSEKDKRNTGIIGFGDEYFDPNMAYERDTYLDTFISFVSTPFPSRRDEMHLHCSTYNPMYNLQPIIQFGPPGALQALRKLGFKTFDKWWSEKYDLIQDDSKRLETILEVVEGLNKLSKEQILEMYKDMKEVLEHNANTLKSYRGSFDISKGIEIVRDESNYN